MDDKEFNQQLSKYGPVIRKPDFQGPSCLPRSSSKAGRSSSTKPTPKQQPQQPQNQRDFWARLEAYAVAKGVAVKDATKLVKAARIIVDLDSRKAESENPEEPVDVD